MELRDLRYFETIARLQHVGRASAVLHRTQPALTGSIRRLEAACGAPLFERAGRGIRLTHAGEVLLKWAQRLRFDVDGARREIDELVQGRTGSLAIGIVPTAAQFLLPSVARQLLQESPELKLRTVVGLIDALLPKLREGEIELMIGTETAERAGLESIPVSEDAIVVAANARHPVFRRTPRPALADLVAYRWALQPPGAPTRDWLDHAFDRHRLPRPQVQIESTTLIMLPALIVQSGLLSFISRLHLSGSARVPGLKEVPLLQATMRRRLVVTWRDSGYRAQAARRLVELFAEAQRAS